MSDMGSLLATKYRILGQEADARTTSAQGEANLANAKAKYEVPAAGALSAAQAGHLDEQTKYLGLTANATAGLQGAQGNYYNSHAALNRADLFPDEHLRGAIGSLYDMMRQYQPNGGQQQPNGGQQQPNNQAVPAAPAGAMPARSILDNGQKGGNIGDAYGGTTPKIDTGYAGTGLPGYNHTPSSLTVSSPNFVDMTKPIPYAKGTADAGNWQDRANASVDAAAARNGQAVVQPMPPAPALAGYARGCGTVHDFAKGTDHVPGQGTGAVDKVPAMLAPHEAVLNAGAAQHVGPHLIDVLNALGAHKMAMEGHAPQPGPQDAPQAAPGKGMPAPKAKAAGKGAPPVKAATGNSNVQKTKPTPTKQATPSHQADDPLGWSNPVTAQTLQTAAGYAQGTSFVQGFGAPSAPQSSNNDYASALAKQDPNSVANTVSDIRSKLTGGATSTPRVVPGR